MPIEKFQFPTNPFEDINPNDFNKLNKKHVTEDFVEDNFKRLNWDVLKPFNDTGIDRILIKTVCPNGHTKLHENIKNKDCDVCGSKGIEILRFIQVKTRQLKNDIFGFTLKSKDIRIDPRHIYLLYSDNTTDKKQDFLIVPVKEYLQFFINNNINPFASMSFRKGNNKLNSLKYDRRRDTWKWGRHSWEKFRNEKGLEMIQSPSIDLDFETQIIETRDLSDILQKRFSGGRTYSSNTERIINSELREKLSLYNDRTEILQLRKSVERYLKEKCNQDTLESMHKYLEFIKTTETSGEDDVD